MDYPNCPLNYVLVQIDKRYQDTITTESGIQFYKETKFNPGWHATISGKVISLPDAITKDAYHRGFHVEVKPGDEILFSYRVVYDEKYTGFNDHVFYEEESPNATETVWVNKEGLILIRRYLMNDKWSCICFDKEGNTHDAMTGGEKEVEYWLSKYSFSNHTEISFKNLIQIDGEDYWKVDVAHIIAVRKGGNFIMEGGNVMLTPHQVVEQTKGTIILLGDTHRENRNQATATVNAIGKQRGGRVPVSAKVGDEVYYDKRFAEHYEIDGKEFIILKQERVLAHDHR